MVSSVVTITGSTSADPVSSGPDALNLANIIGNLLSNIQGSSELQVTPATIGGALTTAPLLTDGQTTNELEITGNDPVNATIPAGYTYVAAVGSVPATLTGSNIAIVSGTVGSSFHVSGQSTVAATGGNNTISASGNYVISTGQGNNIVVANGTGTVATGVGQSTINVGAGTIAGARNVVVSQGNDDLVVSASGLTTVTASGTGVGILGDTGTVQAALTGGAATLSAGQSDAFATTSGSNAVVFGGNVTGSGTLSLTNTGGNNTVATYQSDATVNSSGNNAAIFGGSGTTNITVSGTSSTLVGGSGDQTVSASSNALVYGGTGALTFVGGDGTATVVGNTGATEQITVGAGGVAFAAENNNQSTITSGTGGATMFGGSGSTVNYVGSLAGGIFVATTGTETLNAAGSSTSNFFSGGSAAGGNVSMVGGSGADTLLAGAGADTMVGGAGSNVFAFFAAATNGSQNYVTDFNANDSLYLIGYATTQSAAALLTNATTTNGVTLTLSDSTKVTFTNLSSTTALNGHILYS